MGDLEQTILPTVSALGYELWGCQYTGHIVRVYIDSPHGISADDCQKVSRQVSAVLDVVGQWTNPYVLEVSSPGMDRPLFTLDQCQRYCGQKLQLKLRVPQQHRRNYTGILLQVFKEQIQLDVEGAAIDIAWANVEKANLHPF